MPALADLITRWPVMHDAARAKRYRDDLDAHLLTDSRLATLRDALARPAVANLIDGVFSASDYLSGLALKRPASLQQALLTDPATRLQDLSSAVHNEMSACTTLAEAMRPLRLFKADAALFLALADIGGLYADVEVSRGIALAADVTVREALAFLFRQAQSRGDWLDTAADAHARSGYSVIAMGKHGANELNYSSDIDLIVFYDPGKARGRLAEKHDEQTFFVRLTRDLVRLMQERTEHGYVFRTDLRLRPDPGAMPIAIRLETALNYYESFGQNWERAAMIKARAIAGDMDVGAELIAALQPFIWRKYLDYAAIADIQAMKRQIHAVKGFSDIRVAGHNIKLGRGGIREIEFFTQTQQLIAGGRQRDQRETATLVALKKLEERTWITPDVREELHRAYVHLRTIEHRLQMLDDEQTQTLPEDESGLARLAHFSGYADTAAFSDALTATLETVQRHYVRLFERAPALSSGGANMVFAGEADDPATLAALRDLGFSDAPGVIALVRGWHHGRYRAIRSARARELLTVVQPQLISALAKTADPDEAIHAFDRFLSELPSGVQVFSLLKENPGLLDLVAAIMGSAPRLARVLGRHRRVLDAVLDPGFFGALANRAMIRAIVSAEMGSSETGAATDLQTALDRARAVGHEQAFLIGVRVLTGTIEADRAGGAYALLADQLIEALANRVREEMERVHGRIAGGGAVVIAMGKLGGREMTASSDLDLIVVYDFATDAVASDGGKALSPTEYYARFTQRLIAAFNAQTAEGQLYEIDMRLRPSGQKGPVATQLTSFIDYQARDAWTWEHMALTRARIVTGPPDLAAKVERTIHDTLTLARDRAKIAADVRDMRARIAADKGTADIWDLKQVRGGLVDLEFIAQHLQLITAHAHPHVLDQNTAHALAKLHAAQRLTTEAASKLQAAADLLHNLTQVLRLCLDGRFDPSKAPDGLKLLLARAANLPTFDVLEAHLRATLSEVTTLFDELVV
jgi:[glutamine synthetase] adenylyltransferase / [glutamine synthetase]-adenylyl-L-tyrosine phosphorylase